MSITPDIITTVLKQFGLEPKSSPIFLEGGLSGRAIYRLNTQQGEVVLKQVLSNNEAGYFEAVAHLQYVLSQENVLVPKVMSSKNGKFVEEGFWIQEFIRGRHVRRWLESHYQAVGKTLGYLDSVLAKQEPKEIATDASNIFIRCKKLDYIENILIPYRHYDSLPIGYKAEVSETLSLLKKEFQEDSNNELVLCHVDIHRQNIIFDNGYRAWLIDLVPELHPPAYTLGVALYWLAYPSHYKSPNLNAVFHITRSYDQHYPLSSKIRRGLPFYILHHSLAQLTYSMAAQIDGSSQPPKMLQEKLRRHEILRRSLEKVSKIISGI